MTPVRVTMAAVRCRPYIGGIESHIAEVVPRLTERGFEVTVASIDLDRRYPHRAKAEGVEFRRFRAWPKRRDYYISPGLFAFLLRGDYDLLHVQGVHTFVPPVAMAAAWLRRRPYVVSLHTAGAANGLRAKARATQFRLLAPLLRRAETVIAVCEFEARLFERILGFPEGSIQLVRNGGHVADTASVPATPDHRVIGSDLGDSVVLSVGRLEKYKGHHRVIAAMPEIRRRRPNARLVILGVGPYEADLRREAARHGVTDAVTIRSVDPNDRQAMAQELMAAQVSVLLSEYEAHPLAVMEALAAGRPAVVAATSGMTELVELGWATGVDPDASPADVATVIVSQMDRPQCPPLAALPTWDGCVDRLAALYEKAA